MYSSYQNKKTKFRLRVSYWKHGTVHKQNIQVDERIFRLLPNYEKGAVYFLAKKTCQTLITRGKNINLDAIDPQLGDFFIRYLEYYLSRTIIKARVLLTLEKEKFPIKEELISFRRNFNPIYKERESFLKNMDNYIDCYLSSNPRSCSVSSMVTNLCNNYNYYVKDEHYSFLELCIRDRLQAVPRISIHEE